MKKGFTLIELLAVIIILAIIALISTPIVLNVVDSAKKSADKSTAYALLDAAKLYKSEALFDSSKQNKIDNLLNIFDDVVLLNKPKTGELYISNVGAMAVSVILRDNCYIKKFTDKDIYVTSIDDCSLGWVGKDDTKPAVNQEVIQGKINEYGWYKEDIYIKVNITDNESGVNGYTRCISSSECEPTNDIYNTPIIVTNENENNTVCVIGIDNQGNKSEKNCIVYKLDKTAPVLIEKSPDGSIIQGENNDVSSYFNVTYSISGGSLICNPVNTSALAVGNQIVSCTATGNNGLQTSASKTLIVNPNVYTWKKYTVNTSYTNSTKPISVNFVFDINVPLTFPSGVHSSYDYYTYKVPTIIEDIDGKYKFDSSQWEETLDYGQLKAAGNGTNITSLDGNSKIYLAMTITESPSYIEISLPQNVVVNADRREFTVAGTMYFHNTHYSRGDYISTVTDKNSSAYPNNGQLGGYWYVKQ